LVYISSKEKKEDIIIDDEESKEKGNEKNDIIIEDEKEIEINSEDKEVYDNNFSFKERMNNKSISNISCENDFKNNEKEANPLEETAIFGNKSKNNEEIKHQMLNFGVNESTNINIKKNEIIKNESKTVIKRDKSLNRIEILNNININISDQDEYIKDINSKDINPKDYAYNPFKNCYAKLRKFDNPNFLDENDCDAFGPIENLKMTRAILKKKIYHIQMNNFIDYDNNLEYILGGKTHYDYYFIFQDDDQNFYIQIKFDNNKTLTLEKMSNCIFLKPITDYFFIENLLDNTRLIDIKISKKSTFLNLEKKVSNWKVYTKVNKKIINYCLEIGIKIYIE